MTSYQEHQNHVIEIALMLEQEFPQMDSKKIGQAAKQIYFAGLEAMVRTLKVAQ